MDYRQRFGQYRDDKMQLAVLTAAQLFLEKGIESVKMTDLAEACGVGVASLYRYFGTKTAIVTEAGALLWRDAARLFEDALKSPEFLARSGLEQVRAIWGMFLELYRSQPAFLRFLYEFDDFVLREKPGEAAMTAYEKSVLDLYPIFQRSFEKGRGDGSIAYAGDEKAYYAAVSHSLMLLAQKHLRGDILAADSALPGEQELKLVADMAAAYLMRNEK